MESYNGVVLVLGMFIFSLTGLVCLSDQQCAVLITEGIIFHMFSQNLDVNLAVNNLLSRDDEDGDDQEEGDSYISGGGKSRNKTKIITSIFLGRLQISLNN